MGVMDELGVWDRWEDIKLAEAGEMHGPDTSNASSASRRVSREHIQALTQLCVDARRLLHSHHRHTHQLASSLPPDLP